MKKPQIIPIHRLTQHCTDEIPAYFKVSSFDAAACTVAEFQENHRHEHYEIVWLKQGQGIHYIDGVAYPYLGSVVFLLSPGQVHRIAQEEKAEGFVLKFLPDIFYNAGDVEKFLLHSSLFDNIERQPLLKTTSTLSPVLEELFTRLAREMNSDEAGRDDILRSYLQILLVHLLRLKQQQSQLLQVSRDLAFDLFQNYKIAIEKHYRHLHQVQDYAQILNTQARSLNKVVRKYAARSAGQLIDERILLEARRYLHHGTLSIKEIAFELGFEDPAYFNRFFKKNMGVAPQQFKFQEQNRLTKVG